MDGFFEILMMVVMIWVFSRGVKKKKRQARPPEADAEERGEQKPLDWDKAIGDVLEGFGLQRPEQAEKQEQKQNSSPEEASWQLEAPSRSEAEARRRAEMARQMEVQRAEARRGTTRTAEQGGWEVRDVTTGPAAETGRGLQRARSSDLAEIAGLAEATARRRAGTSAPPASMSATLRAETAKPGSEAVGLAPPAEVRRSTARGLKKLEGLSELERAIIYAEILGPPKALRSDEGADW
jgi:hypothetical protein